MTEACFELLCCCVALSDSRKNHWHAEQAPLVIVGAGDYCWA